MPCPLTQMNNMIVKDDFGLETYTGAHLDVMNPQVEDIRIKDIAHALANICRFTGHVLSFYSVAQHSVLVARELPIELKLEGLLHDATEAYVSDINHNLKRMMPEYRQVEQIYRNVIAQKFGLAPEVPAEVQAIDREMCHLEARTLMPNVGGWANETRIRDVIVYPLSPTTAYALFSDMFYILTGKGVEG